MNQYILVIITIALSGTIAWSISNSVTHSKLNSDNNLQELNKKSEELSSLISEMEQNTKKLSLSGQAIDTANKKLLDNIYPIHVETGFLRMDKATIPKLTDIEGCVEKRGLFEVEIPFDKPFTQPPKVTLGLSAIDFWKGSDHRIKAEVAKIGNGSFIASLYTWCDTKLSLAEFSWTAIGN